MVYTSRDEPAQASNFPACLSSLNKFLRWLLSLLAPKYFNGLTEVPMFQPVSTVVVWLLEMYLIFLLECMFVLLLSINQYY